jgi:ribosomal protein S18 acetylase RimI-like enzyme
MIDIRRLRPDNIAVLETIAEEVFDGAIDPRRLATYLAFPGHLMVVAMMEARVVGQVAGYVHHHPDRPSELYIDNLGVTPSHRRRGVANRLLDEIQAWGKELSCHDAWIVTHPDNLPAHATYASRGAVAEPIVMFSYGLVEHRL